MRYAVLKMSTHLTLRFNLVYVTKVRTGCFLPRNALETPLDEWDENGNNEAYF